MTLSTVVRRWNLQLISLSLVAGTACSHTPSYPTGPPENLGPLNQINQQITFNASNDTSPSWTADGGHILYTFSFTDSVAVRSTSRCIGIVPANGGSRIWTLCDTRASHADSADLFSAVALRSDGKLLMQQSTGKPGSLSPVTTMLWLADTAAPFSDRQELARFPKLIGDSVIEFLSSAAWINPTTFIAIGNRMTYPAHPPRSSFKDTLARPVYLVRGVINGQSVTLTQIAGTEKAVHWSFLPNGDVLFVRGSPAPPNGYPLLEEAAINRVPADGGPTEYYMNSPNNSPVRGISCRQVCLVLSSVRPTPEIWGSTILAYLYPDDRHYAPIAPGPNAIYGSWDSITLSPEQTRVAYRLGRNIFITGLPTP